MSAAKLFKITVRTGFTLIELLVVVLIIGILSAVALLQYTKAVEKARAMEAVTFTRSWMTAQKAYYLANGTYTQNFEDLDLSFNNAAGTSFSNKYFNFNSHVAGDAASFHIDVVRLNGGYQINGWLSNDKLYDKIMCNPSNAAGTDLCKTFGPLDPALSDKYYPIR